MQAFSGSYIKFLWELVIIIHTRHISPGEKPAPPALGTFYRLFATTQDYIRFIICVIWGSMKSNMLLLCVIPNFWCIVFKMHIFKIFQKFILQEPVLIWRNIIYHCNVKGYVFQKQAWRPLFMFYFYFTS